MKATRAATARGASQAQVHDSSKMGARNREFREQTHAATVLNPYMAGFEILEVLILALSIRHALRTGRAAFWRLVAGIVYGFVLELITIRQLHAYHYGGFSVMVLEVPLAISIAWGNQIYAARLFSDATSLPKWARPLLDALVVIYLDLLVEPIATRLGFWDFGLGRSFDWFGTPFTNFWGFFWVVSSFSAGHRLLERSRVAIWRHLAPLLAIVLGIVTLAAINAFMVYGLSGGARSVATAGVLFAAILTIFVFRPHLMQAPPAVAWQFLFLSMAYFVGAGLISGAVFHPSAIVLVDAFLCAAAGLAFFLGTRGLRAAAVPGK